MAPTRSLLSPLHPTRAQTKIVLRAILASPSMAEVHAALPGFPFGAVQLHAMILQRTATAVCPRSTVATQLLARQVTQ